MVGLVGQACVACPCGIAAEILDNRPGWQSEIYCGDRYAIVILVVRQDLVGEGQLGRVAA